MARTTRNHCYRPFNREAKPARKMTGRKIRNATRAAIRNGNFDALPRHRGTEGWITH